VVVVGVVDVARQRRRTAAIFNPMRNALPLLALLLAACDDGGGTSAPDPDAAPPLRLDAGPLDDGGMPVPRAVDCAAIETAYAAGCPGHLGITEDTTACAAIRDGQGPGPLQATVGLAAAVCAQAGTDCDRLFVCVADAHGLTALTLNARVTGRAVVEGDEFTLDVPGAWAWLATKTDGGPGDLEVLFTHDGGPWYFRLEDFVEEAFDPPYKVNANRPIKLENAEDNVEIPVGEVRIDAFALPGPFDVTATATDMATGEVIDVRVRGSFD
jgi:hypothetical protein